MTRVKEGNMLEPKIEVRFRSLSDTQIRELAKEEWTKFDHDHHVTFSKQHFTLAIYINHNLVGYHHLTITGGRAHLKQMIIKEDYRNTGLEPKMLNYLEMFCKNKGCHKITITTTLNNYIVNLLKKNGYEQEALLKQDICKLDWIILAKRI